MFYILKAYKISLKISSNNTNKWHYYYFEFRAVELLLSQVTNNTTDLSTLQVKLDGRLSSQIDVREALLKQKDKQLIGINYKLYFNKIM
jgi:hypothetical protein